MEDGNKDWILVHREEYKDLIRVDCMVSVLVDLLESELTIEIPTLCRILGRDDIAEKIIAEDERRRKEYSAYLREKGETE